MFCEGTINNLLNREACFDGAQRDGRERTAAWLEGGAARVFDVPNAGWVGVLLEKTTPSKDTKRA